MRLEETILWIMIGIALSVAVLGALGALSPAESYDCYFSISDKKGLGMEIPVDDCIKLKRMCDRRNPSLNVCMDAYSRNCYEPSFSMDVRCAWLIDDRGMSKMCICDMI